MPYRSFLIPVRDPEQAERELNDFLQNQRVLAVDRRWVDQGFDSFWAIWVDYLDPTAGTPAADEKTTGRKRVDYKEVLSPEDFAVFAQLRVLRKELAAEDGVALYTVFTNEQLAQIVQRKTRTKHDLEQIAGVGEARIEKYGSRVFKLLNETWEPVDETSGKTAGTDH